MVSDDAGMGAQAFIHHCVQTAPEPGAVQTERQTRQASQVAESAKAFVQHAEPERDMRRGVEEKHEFDDFSPMHELASNLDGDDTRCGVARQTVWTVRLHLLDRIDVHVHEPANRRSPGPWDIP